MGKRTLSFLLALIMVIGLVPISQVQAEESNDVVYVDESTSMSELVESGLVNMELPKEDTTTGPIAPQTPVQEELHQQMVSPTASVCSCSKPEADIYSHSDDCALRQYYINVCGGSAAQIYDLWRNADGVTRTFLEEYLATNFPKSLEELLLLRDAEAIPDDSQAPDAPERLGGEASVTVDGITVDAVGVPEGSSLTVQEPSAEAKELVEQIVNAAEEEPEQVFIYDISVQNDLSNDWQPEETSVEMSLSIPGLDLNQYTEVRIIHVDDQGNDSLITGMVDENGDIIFETGGFSTFAGFTVDFSYGSAMVSIPGKTSTTMSALFAEMKMPLDAADIVDVQFTDYSLLTVTQEENDWRLTSLVPFTSHETLTFTMNDGNVYEFMVTDAVYAAIKTGINGTVYYDDNGYSRWFADADGTLYSGNIVGYWQSAYWAENAIVYIMGPGEFTIAIQPYYGLSKNATDCYVKMKQVRVQGGADVQFYVGTHFLDPDSDTYSNTTPWSQMQTVHLLSTDPSQSLFYVEKGTLHLEGDQHIKLALKGGQSTATSTWTQKPLINLDEGATKFTADGLVLERGPYGGVYSKALNMSLFQMTNCTFTNTVNRIETIENGTAVKMNGGAIYLTTGTSGSERHVEKFVLSNCTFDTNISGSHGGALYLSDYINEAYITDCTFTDCSSGASGGSISLRGTFGKVQIEGCAFTNSTASKDGGAISSETLAVHESSGSGTEFNRIHTLVLKENTFTNCTATGEYGENDGIGGAINMAVQLENFNMDNCTFIGCSAQGGSTNLAGGCVAFGYSNLGDDATDPYADPRLPWTDAVTWVEDGVTMGNDFRSDTQGWWLTEEQVYRQRTTFGTATITNCTFKDTVNTYQGGALLIRTGCAMEDLNLTDCTIDNCEVADKGSALFFNNCIVGTADLLRCTVSNCRILETIHQGGGTIRTVGQTSVVLTLEDCEIMDNQGNQAGGGLYWNAGQSRPTPGGQDLSTVAIIKDCEFRRNKATGTGDLENELLRYGGGIFCETKMTIQGCIFDGNEAVMGGGVCMGVYNASYRMFQDGEVTQLALDAKTEFYNNKAVNGGGLAIRANRSEALLDTENFAHTVDFTLGGAKVYNNEATNNGGGIYYVAEYYENDELGSAEVHRYTKTINIDNGTVYGNVAGQNGGGIYMSSSNNTTITVSNGTIYGNAAGVNDGGNGGGIYLTGTDATVVVTGGMIGAKLEDGSQVAAPNVAKTVNSVGGNGGGIAVFGGARVEMSGGYIVNNQADIAGGGIAVHDSATMYITEGYVASNQAVYGGGISVNGATGDPNSQDETEKYGMYFNGGHVNDNRVIPNADGRTYGGGICLSNSATMKINDGEIKNNTAASDLEATNFAADQEGGGIAACQNSELTITGGVIDGNKAYDGGGVVVRGASSVNMTGSVTVINDDVVTQADGVIKNNWAQRYGGGIDLVDSKSTMIINNGYIYNNSSVVAGGGFYGGQNSSIELNNGRIEANQSRDGGGMYVYAGVAKITGGTIKGNQSTLSGGGIRAQYGQVTVEGGVFSDNAAGTFGGAITGYCNRLDDTYTYALRINITGGVFENNTAETMGGAVCSEQGFVTISGGTFTGNTAKSANGGGIYMVNSSATISDGLFQANTANNGGGLYANATTTNITGGTFQENSAAISGGALCSANGNLTLSGGTFSGNIAQTSNGGAIYIVRSDATVSNGQFMDNAGRYGGGLFIDASTVNFTGGSFKNNKSNQGAGLFIRDSSVEIENITVQNNTCTSDDGRYTADNLGNIYGGGVLIDALSGVCAVTINTGTFSNNSAPCGGGLWVKNISGKEDRTVTLTINGGDVINNTATVDGGGIYVHGGGFGTEDEYTSLTLNGGTISKNIAVGNGGGVWAGELARVSINGTQDIRGVVTENTANNGGGVYVSRGANLSVHNGFIIKNSAVAPSGATELTTAKGNDNLLSGTGGGICVTAGASAENLSSFVLTGDNMAIYDNTATFAADDVFSSGNNTKLTVPTVANMNMAGYDFKPEGWFEDYNTADSAYLEGLNMVTVNGGADGGSIEVLRYRNAIAFKRRYMHILPDYVSDDGVNKVNAYVAMTLGIPAAVDDTVVVDFGNTVDIDVWRNDLFMVAGDFGDTTDDAGQTVYHSYIGYEVPDIVQYKHGVYYSSIKPNTGDKYGIYPDELSDGLNGKITNLKNGFLAFEFSTMSADQVDTFFYMVQHNGIWYYADITVLPATIVYYEDNNVAIKYHTQADSQYDHLADWEVVGTAVTGGQNQDRPGASVLEYLDADNIYGYDGSYTTSTTYSGGAIHKVTTKRHFSVDESGDGKCDECGVAVELTHERNDTHTTNGRATFTFTGTGFDIISLSSKTTGLVTVSVYEGTENIVFEDDPSTPEWEATNPYKTWMVDTYYDAGDTLYQVPVIKASGLPYGTYTVELYVAPSWLPQEHAYDTADFYLDAIRIYDPMGVGGEKSQFAQDTYVSDGEGWPTYAEIRNMFINQGDLDDETVLEGILFIDGLETPTLDTYRSWGPNNEIYLNPGQSVAFTLDVANYAQMVDAVHLGLRSLNGEGHVLVQAKAETDAQKSTVLETNLSVTDLYYEINGAMNKVVTITNDGDAPISVTNVKVTHTEAPSSNYSLRKMFTADVRTGNIALDILTPEQLTDPVLKPKYPALSFNGMVCYNVFFSAEELGNLTAADLGLAVFDSYDPEGTVENAKDVILGATEVDGLYMVATNGVHAKYLGDTQYFRAFAKQADGSYIYSKMVSYSALDYAKSALAQSGDVKLKQLVVAMLNYGAEAQKFFGYKTDDLMNKDLTAEQQALLEGYDVSSLNSVGKVDASKVGAFASTGGFTKKNPAISFKGAFEINYFFTPANAVDGDMTLYFWNEDTYNSVTELTAENADKAVVMALENGSYTASSDEIAAKYLDKTVYVAAVYESDGQTYCSGVLPYSIAAYCQKPPAGVQALATAAAIYGCTAKEFFGV